jgi:hypothetical protein
MQARFCELATVMVWLLLWEGLIDFGVTGRVIQSCWYLSGETTHTSNAC